jgi:drug/metabolite transporter (DMT)-like permease
LAKLAGEAHLSPLAFLCWSIIGAALVLMVVAAQRRELPPVNTRTLEYYAVSALVGVAGSNLILFSAVQHVGASFVALIISLPPLLTYLGALAFRMERFQRLRAAGVAAALAGAGTLAARKLSAPDADGFWILLALAGPCLLAIGNLYRTLRWPDGVSAAALAPGMLIAAAVMLLGAGFLPGFSLAVPMDSLPLVLIIVQAAVFAGMFLLLFMLQKTGGPVLYAAENRWSGSAEPAGLGWRPCWRTRRDISAGRDTTRGPVSGRYPDCRWHCPAYARQGQV